MNLIDHDIGNAGGERSESEDGKDVRGEASHKKETVPRLVADEQVIGRPD